MRIEDQKCRIEEEIKESTNINLKELANIQTGQLIDCILLVQFATADIEVVYISWKKELTLKCTAAAFDVDMEMKLELWGDHVQNLVSNNVYFFKNLRVKSDGNSKYLTMTPVSAATEVLEHNIIAKSSSVQVQVCEFPPVAIEAFRTTYHCPKCHLSCRSSNANILQMLKMFVNG